MGDIAGGHTRCATSVPMVLLRRTLGGYIKHPNTASGLLIALGEEHNDLESFLQEQQLEVGTELQTLVMQELGGTGAASKPVRRRRENARQSQRGEARNCVRRAHHERPAMRWVDGFSGLSANPAMGAAMELLIAHGGTAILSETSEIFGVEHALTARTRTPEVGHMLVTRMNWWLKYNEGRDTQINGRVSPGNNAGGLANVLEKSLGGAKKGGNASLMEVYESAEPVTQHGLVFMDTPGYDPVAFPVSSHQS